MPLVVGDEVQFVHSWDKTKYRIDKITPHGKGTTMKLVDEKGQIRWSLPDRIRKTGEQ